MLVYSRLWFAVVLVILVCLQRLLSIVQHPFIQHQNLLVFLDGQVRLSDEIAPKDKHWQCAPRYEPTEHNTKYYFLNHHCSSCGRAISSVCVWAITVEESDVWSRYLTCTGFPGHNPDWLQRSRLQVKLYGHWRKNVAKPVGAIKWGLSSSFGQSDFLLWTYSRWPYHQLQSITVELEHVFLQVDWRSCHPINGVKALKTTMMMPMPRWS